MSPTGTGAQPVGGQPAPAPATPNTPGQPAGNPAGTVDNSGDEGQTPGQAVEKQTEHTRVDRVTEKPAKG